MDEMIGPIGSIGIRSVTGQGLTLPVYSDMETFNEFPCHMRIRWMKVESMEMMMRLTVSQQEGPHMTEWVEDAG